MISCFLSSVLLFFFFSFGFVGHASAQGDTSQGGGSVTGITFDCGLDASGKQTKKDAIGAPLYGDCTFADLINAVKKLINWGIGFALSFSVVVLAYAGFKYLTSEGNPGKLSEAHTMFWRVAEGIVWILSAWLIVQLIASALLTKVIRDMIPL